MTQQLPLGIRLRDSNTFENYLPRQNELLVQQLCQCSESYLYLWGAPGTGKTHLLQAVCHAATEGASSAYIPLQDIGALAPEMLQGLEQLACVCLDDIQVIADDKLWETAIFHLYNRVRDQGGRLIVAGTTAPPALSLSLPDLTSRLAWGPVYQLAPLDDSAKVAAMTLRAQARGLILPEEVAGYLLKRCPRDMAALFALLERLDLASLAEQRKLTIPFVRQFIETPSKA